MVPLIAGDVGWYLFTGCVGLYFLFVCRHEWLYCGWWWKAHSQEERRGLLLRAVSHFPHDFWHQLLIFSSISLTHPSTPSWCPRVQNFSVPPVHFWRPKKYSVWTLTPLSLTSWKGRDWEVTRRGRKEKERRKRYVGKGSGALVCYP